MSAAVSLGETDGELKPRSLSFFSGYKCWVGFVTSRHATRLIFNIVGNVSIDMEITIDAISGKLFGRDGVRMDNAFFPFRTFMFFFTLMFCISRSDD